MAKSRHHRRHEPNKNKTQKLKEKQIAALRKIKAVPKTALKFGTVVYAHVPFNDGPGWKSRPVVVLDGSEPLLVAPVTSSENGVEWPGAVELQDWKEAGMTRPCSFTGRTVYLSRVDVLNIIGWLTEADLGTAADLLQQEHRRAAHYTTSD